MPSTVKTASLLSRDIPPLRITAAARSPVVSDDVSVAEAVGWWSGDGGGGGDDDIGGSGDGDEDVGAVGGIDVVSSSSSTDRAFRMLETMSVGSVDCRWRHGLDDLGCTASCLFTLIIAA